MLIFGFIILLWLTTGLGLHAAMQKRHIGSLMQSGGAALFSPSVWDALKKHIQNKWILIY